MVRLQDISNLTPEICQNIDFILTDFDDTLTWQGLLPIAAHQALSDLAELGIKVIPVTGGCAGWSDMMARVLPVEVVITEGGACFIHKAPDSRLTYQFWENESDMRAQQARLLAQVSPILERFPQLTLARDQSYRLTDVAIDYAQDVSPPALQEKEACLTELLRLGLNAKASSIHINICSEGYDKFAMAQRVLNQKYGLSDQEQKTNVLYVGDAPNDESMFAQFPLSVGVANIVEHLPKMQYLPSYQTNQPGGLGFAELVNHLLSKRSPAKH
ncbi:HAD-IIB family hydrolase [Marinomonas sp. C2222]|uniref:HAD-IIB family hydrolase n=1 Tax=Marinomonas sargassi TaxID=2984494 RepID=A0ABT2YPE6_9GAMM|nr:HAD-IIB family hydrolase [Marinomonas sargassi]MCV2401763.1 HAD-IIB family hydrolase [Marinomonas sargassi]